MKITTWNINSVRLRIKTVADFLAKEAPDVLCLQEIKCLNNQFPQKAFEKAGYYHIAVSGQLGYQGVAIVSKLPLDRITRAEFCGKSDARHVAVCLPDNIELHNFYVPAGGDEPDPLTNEKFDHKLKFLGEMIEMFSTPTRKKRILVGDLNIAPHEHDVWSHKQLLKVVSHTPVETELLLQLRDKGQWIDVARELVPEPEKLYTWWSYRAKDWRASNRGRRLDHIWVSPTPKKAALGLGRDAFVIHDNWRDGEKPSDHAPVSHKFDL